MSEFSNLTNWIDAIEESDFYIAIFDKHFEHDAKAFAQWAYAKKLKKPFRVLLEHGVEIPAYMLNGIENIRIEPVDLMAEGSVKEATRKVLKMIDREP